MEPPAITEAIRLLRIIDRATIGESRPSRGEQFIGWQRGDVDEKELDALRLDVRSYLATYDRG
jgi:hypothetical protein